MDWLVSSRAHPVDQVFEKLCALTPLYILVWRLILSYFTIGFGFFVFTTWVRKGLKGISTEGEEGTETA